MKEESESDFRFSACQLFSLSEKVGGVVVIVIMLMLDAGFGIIPCLPIMWEGASVPRPILILIMLLLMIASLPRRSRSEGRDHSGGCFLTA